MHIIPRIPVQSAGGAIGEAPCTITPQCAFSMVGSLSMGRFRPSISAKLIGLTTISIAAIVGLLAWYFAARNVEMLGRGQRDRVATYGELLAKETRSAVAFSDRETAREVLSALSADEELAAAKLFGAGGEVLYEAGTPSAWVERARAGVTSQRVANLDDRVAVIAPVVSLEGPRGTLVIELSKARMFAEERAIERAALLAGLVGIALGTLLAWWIARSVVRRIARIGRVATHVRAEALTERVVVDSADEIGVLAGAFNRMLDQLHSDRAEIERTVANLRVAEEALAQTNRELESRVEARTSELRIANETLREEMERRTAMELELRQAQKLESVGRLAAGVAHEINTPVQFSSDSVAFVGEATTELIETIVARRAILTELTAERITLAEALVQAQAVDDEHDVAYLMQQIPKAVARAEQGLDRVAKIVGAMKELAYADNTERADADLNRAIETTLVVARNEYKYVADVETALGDIPFVKCHLGELNQVFLNIIVNAAHAIEEAVRGTARRGRITIATREVGDRVVITIADDGCGIPDSIRDKIFDPFFTTKEIGKGTGQGLAIARSVVEKHGGKLGVDSEPMKGTTFTIQLPIGNAVGEREAA
jgi:signal transduction histidine kinase